MLNMYTIASPLEQIIFSCRLEHSTAYTFRYQVQLTDQVPIIISNNGRPSLVIASWKGIKQSGDHFTPMKGILKKKPYNRLIQTGRCAIPANCFFGSTKGTPYLIRMLNHRLFCFGGIFEEVYAAGVKHLTFSILQVEAADVLATYVNKMPLLFSTHSLSKWLNSNHLLPIMELADDADKHWFDFFPIDRRILLPSTNNKNLLAPTGPSFNDIRSQSGTNIVIDFKEKRGRRGK